MSSLRKRDESGIPVRLYSAWSPMSQQDVHWCHNLSERPKLCNTFLGHTYSCWRKVSLLKTNHIANAEHVYNIQERYCVLQIRLRYSSCSIVHAVFYRKVHWLKGLRKGVWPSCSDFAVENNTLIRRLNKYIEAFAANILKPNIPWYHRHLIFKDKVLCMNCIVGYLQYSSQFMQWLR